MSTLSCQYIKSTITVKVAAVEKCGKVGGTARPFYESRTPTIAAMHACSACAGDYEDPGGREDPRSLTTKAIATNTKWSWKAN